MGALDECRGRRNAAPALDSAAYVEDVTSCCAERGAPRAGGGFGRAARRSRRAVAAAHRWRDLDVLLVELDLPAGATRGEVHAGRARRHVLPPALGGGFAAADGH